MSAAIKVSVLDRLAEAVRYSLRRAGSGIERVEVPAPGVDPIEWLRGRPAGSRFYWRSRNGSDVAAASGAVLTVDERDVVDLTSSLRGHLEVLPPGSSFHGAVRFDPVADLSPEWESFGRVRFVLPRFELRANDAGATLACHVSPADRDDPAELESSLAALSRVQTGTSGDGLTAPAISSQTRAVPSRRIDLPNRRSWVA